MSPNPGPTFDIAEAEPDIAVIKSKPFKIKCSQNKKNEKIKKNKSYY